jgi:ribokinase
MPQKPRIVVVGSANVDLTTFNDRFPRAGETIFGRDFNLGFGGKGTNQAVAARRLGADVHMVARVGDDLFGPATIANLESWGIDSSHVQITPGVSSGVASIFVEESGQNRIIVVKGANDQLTPADVNRALPVIRSADCVVLQFEIPMETVYHTVDLARTHGVACILNPAPAQPVDFQRIASVDYFIPNETEAETIAGLPVRDTSAAEECATFLREQGISRVVVTLGEQGAVFAQGDSSDSLVAPFPIDALDTTGAGDAFIGSFSVLLAEGRPPREGLSLASLYAAMSTTKVGTHASYPSRVELEAEWRRREGAAGAG